MAGGVVARSEYPSYNGLMSGANYWRKKTCHYCCLIHSPGRNAIFVNACFEVSLETCHLTCSPAQDELTTNPGFKQVSNAVLCTPIAFCILQRGPNTLFVYD